MERRMTGNCHVRCEAGEKAAITSKPYLSLFPKIESAEMMFSAGRSRRISMVPIIQSFAQLDKNYGREGSEIITDNCQLTLFGGFAPNSKSAEELSKSLGTQTVSTGSVSKGKNDPSRSLQMMERPLMTPDELKALPFGCFIIAKTGCHPMQARLKLFFKWGIELNRPYEVQGKKVRKVVYADRDELIGEILNRYPPPEIRNMPQMPANVDISKIRRLEDDA